MRIDGTLMVSVQNGLPDPATAAENTAPATPGILFAEILQTCPGLGLEEAQGDGEDPVPGGKPAKQGPTEQANMLGLLLGSVLASPGAPECATPVSAAGAEDMCENAIDASAPGQSPIVSTSQAVPVATAAEVTSAILSVTSATPELPDTAPDSGKDSTGPKDSPERLSGRSEDPGLAAGKQDASPVQISESAPGRGDPGKEAPDTGPGLRLQALIAPAESKEQSRMQGPVKRAVVAAPKVTANVEAGAESNRPDPPSPSLAADPPRMLPEAVATVTTGTQGPAEAALKLRPKGSQEPQEGEVTEPAKAGETAGRKDPFVWSSKPVDLSDPIPGRPGGRGTGEPQHESVGGRIPDAAIVGGKRETQLQAPPQASGNRNQEFFFQLAEKVQVVVRGGNKEIRVQLRPENLGRLQINAENGIHGVVARIAAESESVRSYLESNIHLLQRSFQDLGLKVERIDVMMQPRFEDFGASARQQSGQNGGADNSGDSPLASSWRRPRDTSEDEILLDPLTLMYLNPNSTFHTTA